MTEVSKLVVTSKLSGPLERVMDPSAVVDMIPLVKKTPYFKVLGIRNGLSFFITVIALPNSYLTSTPALPIPAPCWDGKEREREREREIAYLRRASRSQKRA